VPVNNVRVSAFAKTNLFLHVLAREVSGFHNIETLFALLELHDELTIEKTDGGIAITVDGADTGPERQNLAYKAADKVLAATDRTFGVNIRLTKTIPVQAGLGGGSSDAAATLLAMNMLADNSISEQQILQFAAELGSDVPFFASRAAFALGWGRGERLLEIPGPSSAPALIVLPGFGVSTGEAFESLSAFHAGGKAYHPRVLALEDLTEWEMIKHHSANDFEAVLLDRKPALREVFSRLENTEPTITRLCGSGSATIAIYNTVSDRDAAHNSLSDLAQVIPTNIRAAAAPAPTKPKPM
jgi:4-diphosphocytidyl-2-C-methyl-D-erythritol kinase